MRRQATHQFGPLFLVARRGDVAFVVKYDVAARRQRRWHEGQLDDRPHADRHQKIENLVGVEKRINECVTLANQRSHVVVQQSVEPYIAEIEIGLCLAQLRLPVGPQSQRRVTAANASAPRVVQWHGFSIKVGSKGGGHVGRDRNVVNLL